MEKNLHSVRFSQFVNELLSLFLHVSKSQKRNALKGLGIIGSVLILLEFPGLLHDLFDVIS